MFLAKWTPEEGWDHARVVPYGPLTLDPATAVLHYAQEVFEGLKAYSHADGSIWLFRPEENAARMQRSAHRLALPELPTEWFLGSIDVLLEADGAWVPKGEEKSLYLRPFMVRDTVEFLTSEGRRVFVDCEHFFNGYQDNPDYATQVVQTACRPSSPTRPSPGTVGSCWCGRCRSPTSWSSTHEPGAGSARSRRPGCRRANRSRWNRTAGPSCWEARAGIRR